MRFMMNPWLSRLVITVWYGLAVSHLWPPASVVHGTTIHGYRLWAFGHLAYSDIFALYQNHRFYTRAFPYVKTPVEYPVLMGVLMWAVSAVTTSAKGFFAVTAALLWLAALASYQYFRRVSPAVAGAFAWNPLLLVYGLLNWDMLGILWLLIAHDAYRRHRYRLSAAFWAAAVFFKFFPVFFLLPLAAALWRPPHRALFWRMLGVFSLTAAIVNLPFALLNWNNWSLFFTFNAARPVAGDLWNNAFVHLASPRVVDLASLAVVLAAYLLVLKNLPRPWSVEAGAAFFFAVFLVVNKVFSPQYMLWLTAFGLLAGWPPWASILLALAGLVDYVNSLAMMYLTLVPGDADAARWYGATLYQVGLFLRYSSLTAVIGGSLEKLAILPGRRASLVSPRTPADER
ncbi:MAG: hypothetical protein OWU84_13915 [Firmicutes bacterium]|nr:hypothetical protein [Bacillota bacterium]